MLPDASRDGRVKAHVDVARLDAIAPRDRRGVLSKDRPQLLDLGVARVCGRELADRGIHRVTELEHRLDRPFAVHRAREDREVDHRRDG